MEKPERVTSPKSSEISKISNANILQTLEETFALAHNDRVALNLKTLMSTIDGEDPEIVVTAIERGRRGEYGDVYRVDGITVLSWITKRKRELAEEGHRTNQIGFM